MKTDGGLGLDFAAATIVSSWQIHVSGQRQSDIEQEVAVQEAF